MNPAEESLLYRIMHPRSIAFWGASHNPMGMGSVQLSQLLHLGYQGRIYPIHPRASEIMGLQAYAIIADVPETVDLAIFVLPTRVVPDILEECGNAGVKRAIVVTAGFGEKGAEGRELQQRLVDIAQRYGMHFLGPNCIGVVNSYENLNTTYFPYEAQPGYVGMASQSGSYVTQMFGCLAGLGLGFSQALSVGNEAMIDITDCLQYLGNCPRTRVIVLYIEAIRRGRQFFRVAMNAGKSKPIIAVYVGGSSAGRQAALSHTGAMAGPDRLYDGMFKQAGIIRAQSILHAFQWCVVLGAQPLPRGQRVGILTHSGGPGASAADAAERQGLEPATFSPDTRQRLLDIVPHTASVENPVDLTFNRDPNEYSKVLPGILLDDPGVDSLFMYLLMPAARVKQAALALGQDPAAAEDAAREFLKQQASAIADLASRYDKPVVGASFSPITDLSVQILREAGVSVLPSPEAAMEALAALSRYARFRRRLASREYEDHAERLGQSGPRAGRGAGAGPDV